MSDEESAPWVGYVAVHPDDERPFCCDDDACVVMETPAALADFIERAIGAPPPENSIIEVDYDQVASDLLEGGALAFDAASYALFTQLAADDGFAGPTFDDLKVTVEGVEDVPLAILELVPNEEKDAPGAESELH